MASFLCFINILDKKKKTVERNAQPDKFSKGVLDILKALTFQNLVFTPHAERRLQERGITKEELYNLITNQENIARRFPETKEE